MKKSEKLLLFIVSLAGLGFSAVILSFFYPLPHLTDMLTTYRTLFPWLNMALAGYASFLCLCFFLLLLAALFSHGRPREMIISKDKGKLRFSKQAIESTVIYSFAGMDGVSFFKVRAKIGRTPDKTRIYVRLSLSDPARLAGLAESIQDRIASALESSLCVKAKSIEIRTVELKAGNEAKAETPADLARSGRVV